MIRNGISIAFIACALLTAQDQTGTIEGTVKDSKTGAPLADMSVALHGATQITTITTDSKGHFSRKGLEPGRYGVFVAPQNGYSSA
ncbi:MAG: carboxypeptidase regulatory-like domain-containing protein, partial [Acidobacteriaceae bacterium]|nr:carboxypeptidase regulatory-like domain-containing protein [Acidobacteriaceae bacterium]